MGQLEAAHLSLIGKAPTYMRPPFLSTNDLAISTLKELGYKIVEIDIDTFDYETGPAGHIADSVQWVSNGLVPIRFFLGANDV